ncbi:MAG: hypothetical protein E6923_04710 [Clostridium sp.]|uniref:hypothetical protein n=1 Tax=Clostridium sp. TaxID=1506 RepID=UPI0028FEDD39|nr:hypothetical protein [Clostridium sp.]MDU1310008.1 hypothetical protein [Clostridium sp.]MDU1407164.1 hypothetical protein [Clostridium sp.]
MKKSTKRKIRDGLLNSKGVIETVVGGSLNLLDPTGIIPEGVKKGIDIAINYIANEFDTRVLSEIESDRVKDVMVTAVKKIEKNLSENKKLREDNFFQKIEDKSDAQEIFEAIIISSQREAQSMKLKFYGNLLANIGFNKDITSDECMQLIEIAERLTYRQCLLMTAIYINTAQYRMMGQASILADRFIHNNEKNIPFSRVSLYQEVLELYRMGLVFEKNGNLIINIGQLNFHNLIVGGLGDRIVELMELDRLMDNELTDKHLYDFNEILKLIKNDSYEEVGTYSYRAKQ